MICGTYPFQLPALPYDYDALEPILERETLRIHHDKHFAAYINNLNTALRPYPQLHNMNLLQLLAFPTRLPQKARCPILRGGGGAYNHDLYFRGLAPLSCDAHQPCGKLLALIERQYGSYENFKDLFTKVASQVFGSGWTVLLLLPNNTLRIVCLRNQETPLLLRGRPLIYLDLWEHAYYLKYQNRRGEYIENLWKLYRWPEL